MSDSVAPASFPFAEATGDQGGQLEWMQVEKADEAVPLVLPSADGSRASTPKTDASESGPAEESQASGGIGPTPPEQHRAAAAESADPEEPGSDAAAAGVPCPDCEEREAALVEARETFAHAVQDMVRFAHEQTHQLEGALVELSLEIARAIAEGMVEVDPELHLELAKAALAQLDSRGEPASEDREREPRVRIRLNPAGQSALENMLEASGTLGGLPVEVVGDDSLKGLGCLIEGPFGRVDGTLETRLDHVRAALRGAWESFGQQPAPAPVPPTSTAPSQKENATDSSEAAPQESPEETRTS